MRHYWLNRQSLLAPWFRSLNSRAVSWTDERTSYYTFAEARGVPRPQWRCRRRNVPPISARRAPLRFSGG